MFAKDQRYGYGGAYNVEAANWDSVPKEWDQPVA
jgi:hypothetical protein